MIALGGPTLKLSVSHSTIQRDSVSMIALGGPNPAVVIVQKRDCAVSMIALGGLKLKPT